MNELTYFYLKTCPYCRQANLYIEELIEENPEFSKIKINKIEERENEKLANSYDYYYVPCFWIGKEKLHEGGITKEEMRKVLNIALSKLLVTTH